MARTTEPGPLYRVYFQTVDGEGLEVAGDDRGSESHSRVAPPFVPAVGDVVRFVSDDNAYRATLREFIYGEERGWTVYVTLALV